MASEKESAPMPAEAGRASAQENLHRLEHEENRLWRIALLFLALLATGLAAAAWQNFAAIPQRLQAIPLGTVLVGVLFAVYVAAKRRELAELKGVVRGMQEREQAPPSEQQLTKLLEAISQSQRHYRELIDSLDTVVLALSLDGVVQTMNRAFTDLVQEPFSEVAGHSLEEYVAEPTRAEAEKGLAKFRERRHWSGVVRVRMKNETAPRYYDCVVHPILKDDVVMGAGVLARDVTAEREREARFTELFETLQEGVYFTTPDGRILDCNHALVRMLGYDSKEELLAVPVQQLYADPGERVRELRQVDQSAAVRNRELRLRRKGGGEMICIDTCRAIFDATGRVLRYQGALIDVTERRAMEDRLHEQEEFRRRLVESFPDLILVLDAEGRYTFVSPRVREVLGYEPENFVGHSIVTEDTGGANGELQQLFHQLVTGKEIFSTSEYAARHADGTWRTLRATASPIFDAQGKLSGVVASVRDVTSLKQMEQQLIQNERLAAMGQMIDGFAHELNNPLTAILGAVELLETSVPDSAGKKFTLLKQQARRAAEVVQNLLFFARAPAPGKAPLNVSELVQRSLQLHEHSLRVNNIAVDFIPDPALPNVVGDPHQLMQVFLNLIINAEQAIREVRPRGTLRIRLGRNGDRIWISFQDDGPGISAEALPKIFDPFFTTKRPGRGTGLGLSVAMAILKKYNGMIEAQAAPGGGAVLQVTLPAAPVMMAAISAAKN